MKSSAVISECGNYRYELRRQWDADLPPMLFIMLNPSTADADTDDPTIRRCISRARAENCGSLIVVNLFALRSPDPKSLKLHSSPVGTENDRHIGMAVDECQYGRGRAVIAWGAMGGYMGRGAQVIKTMGYTGINLFCLGVTKAGHPRHPLYVSKDQPLIRWPVRA